MHEFSSISISTLKVQSILSISISTSCCLHYRHRDQHIFSTQYLIHLLSIMTRLLTWEITKTTFLLKMQNYKQVARGVNCSGKKPKPTKQKKDLPSVNWWLVRNQWIIFNILKSCRDGSVNKELLTYITTVCLSRLRILSVNSQSHSKKNQIFCVEISTIEVC